MTETRVFELTQAAAAALEQRLREQLGDAQWRTVDHARFALKDRGINLVCYRSGKVVVQGADLDPFVLRFLGDVPASGKGTRAAGGAGAIAFDVPTIGCDEAGKGDYFGPLVACAVFAEPSALPVLQQIGVADSKTLDDKRMMAMAGLLEGRFDVEVRALPPVQYNETWAAERNVNVVLAALHAAAIAALLERHPGARVMVDQFATADLIGPRLVKAGRKLAPGQLVQQPRAEAHPVVAAASIVARVHFLEGIKTCADEVGSDLHLGAGAPVDKAGRRVFAIGGLALLGKVAKLHFKNTSRVTGGDA